MSSNRYFPEGLPLAPEEHTLVRFLEFCIERHAGREALVFEHTRLSYAELGAQVRVTARALVACGVNKGERVALLFANRPEFAISVFAIASLGAVIVPISTLALVDERDAILRDSDASLLLMQPVLLGRDFLGDLLSRHPAVASSLPGAIRDPALPCLRRVVCSGEDARAPQSWKGFLAGGESVPIALVDAMKSEISASDDALIFYTSGSTGRPKGVLHRQRAPVFQAFRMATVEGYREGSRSLTGHPMFWTGGFTEGLVAPLSAGATIVLQETLELVRTLALIERERVTHLRMMLHDEARLAAHPEARRADLHTLESGITTEAMRELAGLRGEVTEFTGYGMTETFTLVTALPFSAAIELRRSTHGVVIPGQEVCILDPETGAELGPGESGEIAVRGPTLMRGYYKVDPQTTFDARGFLRTRDIGSFDSQGFLHYEGRVSDVIKTSGANVSPVEIQERLADWGRLEHAVVLGFPHPTRGQAIVLCAVKRTSDPVDEAEILDHLRGALSSFKLPRAVLFFRPSELELTASHKLKLPELRALALERLLGSAIDEDWKDHLRSPGRGSAPV